jgi:3-hydroxymyristoyl/3-hydroxydecanoyl-(acyl carrier protein) dehydratase
MPASDAGFAVLRSEPDGAGGWALAARVPADSRLFAGHFPGHPIVPGVALLALVARAVAGWRGGDEGDAILGVRGLKLRLPVGPGETLAVRLKPASAVDSAGVSFEVRRGGDAGELVASGQVRVGRAAGARQGAAR